MQTQSHEVLLKILNNIGIIGAVLAGIADIVFVIISVVGVNIDIEMKSSIIFASVNAGIGVLINILLRYQGQKYAELENEELCRKFHLKKAEKTKRYIPIGVWQILKAIEDILIKGCTTIFGIYGIIYISIEGSKNPIQILITVFTVILFICFGLINMNSGYYRFYNVQIPHMELIIKEKENKENAIN